MTAELYEYLRGLLRERPMEHVLRPPFVFKGDFKPEHLQCHVTAATVAVQFGFLPVVGIAFLDKDGALFPWPHIVNDQPGVGLVDASPVVDQRQLGFIRTGWHEWAQWRDTTAAYLKLQPTEGSWGDPLADALTGEFFRR